LLRPRPLLPWVFFYGIFLGFFEIELTVLLLFSSSLSRSTTKIWHGFRVKIRGLDFFGGNLEIFLPLGTVDFPEQKIWVFEFGDTK